MNKSKAAQDQRAITELIEFLQRAIYVYDHELGDGKDIPEFVRHTGRTFSIDCYTTKFRLDISVVEEGKKVIEDA